MRSDGVVAKVMVTTPVEMGDLSWGSKGFKLRGPGLEGRTPPGLNDGMLPCMQPGTIIAVATGVHTTRFIAPCINSILCCLRFTR